MHVQLGGMGYKHAGSDRWASHSTRDNSSWGKVSCLLHGSLALLVLPWYVVVCGDTLAQTPCSVPRQQGAAETVSAGSARKGFCSSSAEGCWL